MSKIENLKGRGVKFGEGQDTTQGGRPRKLTNLDNFESYTPVQIRQVFGLCASMTFDELQEIAKDESKEAVWRTCAKFWYESFKTGDYKRIQGIVEQFIGKPNNAVDVTSNGESMTANLKLPEWIRNIRT